MGQHHTWRSSQKYIVIIAFAFTVFIAVSLVYNIRQIDNHAFEKALTEAQTIFDINLAYRRWNAGHGGVYVQVTEKYRPNPYLSIYPRRDLTANDGTRLTLVNPAMMTRRVHQILSDQSELPIINKVTSLHYLNPENRPDEWETAALKSFEKGSREADELTTVNGQPYMRLMKPYMTEEGCLVCHAAQGYRLGDVRGGLSVGVPMKPHLARAAGERKDMYFSHLLIWLIGMTGITLLGVRIRRAEGELIREKELTDTAINTMTGVFFVQDKRGRFVRWNRALREILGVSDEELGEMDRFLPVPPGHRDYVAGKVAEVFEKGHAEAEVPVLIRGGTEERLYYLTARRMEVAGTLYLVGSGIDITDQRKIETQLRQAHKMEALGLMAGGISHDFNNLLSVIIGYTDMLQSELGDATEDTTRYLQTIMTAAEKARDVTAGLLAFSRRQVTRPKIVNVDAVAANIEKLLRSLVSDRHTLTARYGAGDRTVFIDPTQLEQLLLNLVSNARDAMPAGGVIGVETSTATVDEEIAARNDCGRGTYAVLSVRDNGSGIDSKLLPHIFEPFFTTKQTGKGTGLGLSIVYGIVKQHGGFIDVVSRLHQGTTFTIFLPLAEETEQQRRLQEQERMPEDFRGSETILIAEDDEALRLLLGESIGKRGYRPLTAKDGPEAVEISRRFRSEVALLVLDISLPGRDGISVYREISRETPGIKAIFLSGSEPDVPTTREIYRAGLEIMPKPIEMTVLLSRIRSALGRPQ